MGSEAIERAAAALQAAWQGGAGVAPDKVPAADMAEGLRIQDALVGRLGHEVAGWKIGASSTAAMAGAGIDDPMCGRLFRHTLFEPGTRFPRDAFRNCILEAEYAYRMAADLPPRAEAYGETEVLDAVADMVVGVEVADNRYDAPLPIPIPLLTADNAATGAYIVGPSVPDWRNRDTTGIDSSLTVNGKPAGPSLSGEARCDPKWVLVWTANFLSARGLGLKAGDLITTGTACQPVPGGPGQEITAHFAGIGEISLAIEG